MKKSNREKIKNERTTINIVHLANRVKHEH